MAPGTRGLKVQSVAGLKVVGVQQQPLPTQPHAPPLSKPTFDLKDLRAVIPAHCFQRSAIKSLAWLARDLVVVAALFYAATFIDSPMMPFIGRIIFWPLDWYLQGLTMTGVWVLAHECGHQAFSDSRLLNDTVGWILHSALLVPYFRQVLHPFSAKLMSRFLSFSWAISHGNHHKNTNSCENDEVFASPAKSKVSEAVSDSPLMVAINIVVMLLFGW